MPDTSPQQQQPRQWRDGYSESHEDLYREVMTTDQHPARGQESGGGDLDELRAAMEAAKITLPVRVEYDSDGGGEYGPYSRWAYRIPGICNVAEEADASWPNLVPDPEMGAYWATCPRSEYIALLLNSAPSLLAQLAALTQRAEAAEQEKARFVNEAAEAGRLDEESIRRLEAENQRLRGVVDAAECMWAYAIDYASPGTKLQRECDAFKAALDALGTTSTSTATTTQQESVMMAPQMHQDS